MSNGRPLRVLVVAWNNFHSPALVGGLHAAGIEVTYFTTARQLASCQRFIRCFTSALLNQAGFRGLLPQSTAFSVSQIFMAKRAATLVRGHDAVWAWSGCSLPSFYAAIKCGRKRILEVGSTHCLSADKTVRREYQKRGVSLNDLSSEDQINRQLLEYKLAERICVPSERVQRTYIANGIPLSKMAVNPYGVDAGFWNTKTSDEGCLQKTDRKLRVVFVANITPRKGIYYLLEAWRSLRFEQAELALVGGWHLPESPQHLLPPNCVYMGPMSHEELRRFFSSCDLYVLPSIEDGFALTVTEAMAAGLPVIVTDCIGAADCVENGVNGWLVPPFDSRKLASALNEALSMHERLPSMGQRARKTACMLTWEAYGKRAADFLMKFVVSAC